MKTARPAAISRARSAAPPQPVVVGLPDFARGPGQPVAVPASAAGLPLTLNDTRIGGGGVRSVSLIVNYDPMLLNVTAAHLGPDAPANAELVADVSTPGVIALLFSSPDTPLAGVNSRFVTLTAGVPAGAPSGSSHRIAISDLVVTDTAGLCRRHRG